MGANNYIIGEDENGKIHNVEVTEKKELSTIDKKGNKTSYNIEDTLGCILEELKGIRKELKKINK